MIAAGRNRARSPWLCGAVGQITGKSASTRPPVVSSINCAPDTLNGWSSDNATVTAEQWFWHRGLLAPVQ